MLKEEEEDELEEEEERYENLRAEEVLYRVKEKLTELRDRTAAGLDELVEVNRERGDSESVPRRLRPRVTRLKQDVKLFGQGLGQQF